LQCRKKHFEVECCNFDNEYFAQIYNLKKNFFYTNILIQADNTSGQEISAETVTSGADLKDTRKLSQISSEEAGGMGRLIGDEPYYHGFMAQHECVPLLKSAGDFLVRTTEVAHVLHYVITVRADDGAVMNFLIKRTKSISSEEAGGMGRLIGDEPYYHGFMAQHECVPLLKSAGDFLVRTTEVAHVLHYVITKRLYFVYRYAFRTIPDLIAYHSRNHYPLNRNGVYIKNGIEKSEWQLFHEQVELKMKLGEGAFGEVWRGTLTLGVFRGRVPVAVKMLRTGTISNTERVKFLREANLMLRLNHINIIKLYGVATSKEPIMIVMELARGGSVLSRVQNKKDPPTEEEKVKYCSDAVHGLAYLESMQIIHRDVAARNCLIGEENTVKLCDFGLSLLGMQYREKKLKNVPLRWLAPETLKSGRYSFKSDVWSFGVTMWEIFAHGQQPYGETEGNKEIRHGVIHQKLKLTSPSGMPADISELMRRCLQYEPQHRPTALELAQDLDAAKNARMSAKKFSSVIKEMFRL
uniref:Tyrosine-protein kinase n=2 Tax=Ascaris TaxID=6251 RepID=A0A0M3IGB9_ASCLU